MKFIWEESDIKPGRYYYRNESGGPISQNIGYYASVAHKIGYISGNEDDKRYTSIAINDGLVHEGQSKAALADDLNQGGYIPLPHENLLKLVDYLRTQNEGYD